MAEEKKKGSAVIEDNGLDPIQPTGIIAEGEEGNEATGDTGEENTPQETSKMYKYHANTSALYYKGVVYNAVDGVFELPHSKVKGLVAVAEVE